MASARSARRRFPLPRGGHPLSRPPPQMPPDPLPLLMPEGGVARRLLSAAPAADETPERVCVGGEEEEESPSFFFYLSATAPKAPPTMRGQLRDSNATEGDRPVPTELTLLPEQRGPRYPLVPEESRVNFSPVSEVALGASACDVQRCCASREAVAFKTFVAAVSLSLPA